ncbi:uncharacterized protein LOC116851967 [Odontomachus brunneus]|uniref:uncharacterized protein LOC116851967 n=1 Tax=Odontomachus brunneus TaxID=486640 RepID=UPI0013F22D13|nr:uncharacterized protein LOC116851967 [Odontomachus brunneus]
MLSVKHFIKYINNKKYTLQLGYIKMVWKCCVPECKSSWEMPVHRFPVDPARIERWLIAIHKTDLIVENVPDNSDFVPLPIVMDWPALTPSRSPGSPWPCNGTLQRSCRSILSSSTAAWSVSRRRSLSSARASCCSTSAACKPVCSTI